MTLQDFEAQLRELRVRNGWEVTLEFAGIWVITVEDKETHKVLAETGATSLGAAAWILSKPLEDWPK